jgi:hypothetical protein
MEIAREIDIAVPGKFHAFSLASKLAEDSRLGDLYSAHRTTRPPLRVARSQYHNRFDLAVWGGLSRFAPLGYTQQALWRLGGQTTGKETTKSAPFLEWKQPYHLSSA